MSNALAPQEPNDPRPPRFGGLLLAIVCIMLLLSVVFGASILRSRNAFDTYKNQTLRQQTPRWEQEVLDGDACVEHTVAWAMQCPGLESWCANEAPQLTRACLTRGDRSAYCAEISDAAARTSFGYHECEALRERVDGKYAKRSHKKFCAAAYRAVAEFCRSAS